MSLFKRISGEKDGEGHEFVYTYRSRVLCDVLEDMRKCLKSLNFSPIIGLIEEAQVMGNRMEAGLGDVKGIVKLEKAYSDARAAYKSLKSEYQDLLAKKLELESQIEPK